ncbi:MAG TPA: DnaB-like helicase C-terminal domain-containing protein [Phycisphaerae bacterium]|nr:DnaB-like helicase C-terminal domain-containing protein [Phycisphaerae bacterium]
MSKTLPPKYSSHLASEPEAPVLLFSLKEHSLGAIVADARTWEPAQYVPSGILAVDDALGGGLRQGGVTLLVGRSGRGKTTLAVQTAWHCARAGIPVCFYSMEMSGADVAKLICSQVTGVARRGIDRGDLTASQAERVMAARDAMASWPMTILDSSCLPHGLTRREIEQITTIGREALGWRLVVVDYLNLIANDGSDTTEYQTDVLNSTAIKRVAQANDVAVLCIAALRKSAVMAARDKAKGANNSRPVTLDDVLGAGRLVYDATAVLHVNGISDENGNRLEVEILKSRFSAQQDGPLSLDWHPEHGRIESPVANYQYAAGDEREEAEDHLEAEAAHTTSEPLLAAGVTDSQNGRARKGAFS